MLENFKSPSWHPLRQPHPRALDTLVAHKSLRLAHPLVAAMRRCDSSASQFAGQGGFTHPRAAPPRGGRRGWRCGECSTERRRRARAADRRLDASLSARAPRRDPGRARGSTRGASSGRASRPPRPFQILAPTDSPSPPHLPRCPALPERPQRGGVARVARAPHREADRGGRQRDQRGASRARGTRRPRRALSDLGPLRRGWFSNPPRRLATECEIGKIFAPATAFRSDRLARAHTPNRTPPPPTSNASRKTTSPR